MNIWDSQKIEEIGDNTAKMADVLIRIAYALEHLVDRKDEPQTDIPKSALRTDCTGCRFVGSYDTEFPCATCSRKIKDYYEPDQTEPKGEADEGHRPHDGKESD